jgi:phage recombination protein Bet
VTKQTATKAKEAAQPQQAPVDDEARRQNQQVAVLPPPRLPYHPAFKDRYGIDVIMWRALVEAVYPSAKTIEGVILAVSYCKSKNYDVMKKMVHVVPIWSTALGREVEGVWEAVAALRATAFRTNEYAGCDDTEFGPMKSMHFAGEVGKGQWAKHVEMDLEFPEWAKITVYRLVQGVRCAFPGPKVHFLGAYGSQGKSDVPNEKWAEGPSYMLEKCAEAAALRKAFPEALGSTNAAEEMEGRKVNMTGPTIDHESEPTPPRPTRESVKAAAETARQDDYERNRQFRDTMREDTPRHDARTGEIEGDGNATETQARDESGQDTGQQETGAVSAERSDPAAETQTGVHPANSDPPKATASAQGNAGNKAERNSGAAASAPAPNTTDPVNFTKIANEIIKKVMSASALNTIKAIEATYDDDLTLMSTHAPNDFKRVEDAINGKRAKLSSGG